MKWEYKTVKLKIASGFPNALNLDLQYEEMAESNVKILNTLGAEGWEVFQVTGAYYYLKRSVEEYFVVPFEKDTRLRGGWE